MLFVTDGQQTLSLDQAGIFADDAPVMVLLRHKTEDLRFGPFPAAEAIFYARRSSNSAHPQLSMSRFESIHAHCTFKNGLVEFLAAC